MLGVREVASSNLAVPTILHFWLAGGSDRTVWAKGLRHPSRSSKAQISAVGLFPRDFAQRTEHAPLRERKALATVKKRSDAIARLGLERAASTDAALPVLIGNAGGFIGIRLIAC